MLGGRAVGPKSEVEQKLCGAIADSGDRREVEEDRRALALIEVNLGHCEVHEGYTIERRNALARAATGRDGAIAFVPHSGPFARGIHATVQAVLRKPLDTAGAVAAIRGFYAGRPFVRVLDEPPRMKEVVTSNYAHLSAVADGRTIVVMSVVDNLVKGAAGGAIQWMNRLLGFEETDGLLATAPGWT